MNILILTPYLSYPPTFGGAVRIYHLIRQLSRWHHVHLLSFHEELGQGDPKGLEPFCKTITLIPHVMADKRRPSWTGLCSRRSLEWRLHYSTAMQAALSRVVREQHIQLILVEFSQMAGFVFPAGVPVVLDEHNVEFELLDRLTGREGGTLRQWFNRVEARKFRREEMGACRAAAMTLVTSERDGQLLASHSPGLQTTVITNGVDCDHFRRPAGSRRPDSGVFVGATNYFPNEDGVAYFLREVLPLIQEKKPGFRFTVVGGRPPPSVVQYQSGTVEVTGYVDDVRPFMWESSVFVVPLRMGGGTRFKIVEAFAAGIPVVSTRLGAEGIPVQDGRELLLADKPSDLAAAVLRVLENPALAESLAHAGEEFVRRYFDWSVIGDKLNATLEAVVSRK